MIRNVLNFFGVFILLHLFSCGSLMLGLVGANAKEADAKTLSNGKKHLVFIPMHHVGKKEFYNSVYRLTDSLGNLGYKTYYEKVEPKDKLDTVTNFLNYRKLRKLMGRKLSKEGHLDTLTYKIGGRIKVDESYVNQPQANKLVSNKSNPINVDVSLDDFISKYENDYGVIELDTCDFNTAIFDKYDCKSLRDIDKEKHKAFREKFMINYRDQYLANAVNSSKDGKIIIVYGGNHYDGFVKELKKLDASWQEE